MMHVLLLFVFVCCCHAEQIVFIKPGGPASTKQAQQTMNTFAKVLSRLSNKKITATYFNDESKAIEFIKTEQPQIGIVSTAFYITHSQKMSLQLQLQVYIQQKNSMNYVIAVDPNSGIDSLQGLRGKVVASNHLYEADFLSHIFFGGRTTWKSYSSVKPIRRPYSYVKRLFRGRVDAVILDNFQADSIQHLLQKQGKTMRLLPNSSKIPTMPVVSFGKGSSEIVKAMQSLQNDSEGKKLLKLFQIDSFGQVDSKAFAKLRQTK